jgi:hypothetical protein
VTWSYSGDPSSSSLDTVRFLLGDTDHTDELTLSNEEIAFLISEWDNLYFAAAAGAEQLAGQFAREVTYSSDGVTYTGTELQDKYNELAQTLRAAYKRKGLYGIPYDGSNDPRYNDWRSRVEEIGIGMHDIRREGANMDEDEDGAGNPISTVFSPGGYAQG